MALLTKLFSKQAQAIPYSNRGFYAGGAIPSDWSSEDSLQSYLTVGWWHAVVFRIALGMSEVKWTLSDVSNPQKPKQIYQHPLLSLLSLANPFQTSEELIALDTIYMECLGESFWILNYNAIGEPAEIILPYPTSMQVVPDKNFPFVKGYVYGRGADQVPLDVNQVIHFKYPNPMNQFRGLGQATAIGVNLSAERNADRWVDQFFYNSARPDGVIQFDYTLSDEQFDKLKKQWSEKYKGVNKAHQVALLEGGGKYIQIQNSVKDMDFPNLKQKNRDIILGIEGMPLSIMGITENVNKANSEAGDYTFARWVLKPRLDWKKAKLQEQLIPKFKNSQKLKLGFEEIVPETAEQKRLDAESGMRAGYLTVNEARAATGKDPLPPETGDVLLIPLNLIPTPVSGKITPLPAPAPVGEETEEEVEQESYKGGEGSGNFDHAGRPGEVGGSGPGGGGGGGGSSAELSNAASGGELTSHGAEEYVSQNFKNTLSSEQEEGAFDYMARGEKINYAIRTHGDASGTAKIDSAISQQVTPEDIIVYRGTREKALGNVKEGWVLEDKAYTSTTLSKKMALGFAGEYKDAALLKIKIPKGTPVLPMDFIEKGEQEIVLGRKTRFRYSGATKVGSMSVHEMVVVGYQKHFSRQSYKGGEGSGNFGHEGRPGEVGGSGGGGGGGHQAGHRADGTKVNPVRIETGSERAGTQDKKFPVFEREAFESLPHPAVDTYKAGDKVFGWTGDDKAVFVGKVVDDAHNTQIKFGELTAEGYLKNSGKAVFVKTAKMFTPAFD